MILNSYVRLGRFEVEFGVSISQLQHVTRQDFWVVQGGYHVFDGGQHYSGVTIASISVSHYNASEFGKARFQIRIHRQESMKKTKQIGQGPF